MPGLRDLKRRIKGIQGMRKVTRAMQMVSSAKMRKAQQAVLASRTYSELAWELANSVIARSEQGNQATYPGGKIAPAYAKALEKSDGRPMTSLLQPHPNAIKIGVVLLGTNRTLVGSLNSNLGRLLRSVTRPSIGIQGEDGTNNSALPLGRSARYNENHEVISEVIVYGRQAANIAKRTHQNILADFEKTENTVTTQDAYPLAKYITDTYASGEYNRIVIVYNHFVSTLVQRPTVKQLLPFMSNNSGVGAHTVRPKDSDNGNILSSPIQNKNTDYLFEPSPQQVLEHLIPRIIESQLYQAILESNASEHSARMILMKNATDAAGDIISDLTLTYNQVRQGKITTELSEITAGRIALE